MYIETLYKQLLDEKEKVISLLEEEFRHLKSKAN